MIFFFFFEGMASVRPKIVKFDTVLENNWARFSGGRTNNRI